MNKTERKPLPPLVIPGGRQYNTLVKARIAELEERKRKIARREDIIAGIILTIVWIASTLFIGNFI